MDFIGSLKRICCFFTPKNKFVVVVKISIFLIAGLFSKTSLAQLNTLSTVQNTLSSVETVVQGAQAKVEEIKNVINTVKENNLYKSLIDGKEFKFPIGVLPNDGDRNYALVINKVFMTPDGMYAEVFMKVTLSSKTTLYFLADKVPYSRSGGFAGDLRLYLLVTDSLQIGRGYNIEFKGLTNLLGAGSTGVGLKPGTTEECCFITFNCKGFKDVTLAGSVNFDKKTIVDNSKTKNPVSLKFYLQGAAKLSNFVVDFKNIPSFEFTSLPGFKCYMPRFTLDHSELKNAPAFKLPQWYKDSIALIRTKNLTADTSGAGNYNLDGVQWKGIYIDSLVIDIPKAFKEKSPDEIIVITASNIIIDGNGVTGLSKAEGKNNTPFYDGTIKGWEYSIDKLSFNMIASCLSSASISGGITLPVSKKGRENQVGFSLLVSKNIADNDMKYAGSVLLSRTGTGGLINVQAFGLAKMQINDALISFNYAAGQFTPSVNIDGSLTLMPKKKAATPADTAAAAKEKPAAGFGVVFQRLIISTQAPYIDIDRAHGGYCKMSTGGQTMSNFPVSIDTINLIKEAGGQRMGIQISLQVQLQKTGDSQSGGSGFGGAATFTIWTKRDAVTKKWEYDDFSLDKIVIDVNNDAFKLHGELTTFRNDSLYGTGFCGKIALSLMKDKLKIEVAAIFGRTMQYTPDINVPINEATLINEDDASYRYWFVDAGVTFPVIPVAPMVGINGFNGGLYHHMEMQQVGVPLPKPTQVKCNTTSGLTYIPKHSIHLGLLAGIGLQSVPTDAVFNGKITFGIEFNKSGGVNMLAFFGDVTIFTPPVNVPGADKLKTAMSVVKVDEISANKEQTKAEVPKEETPTKGSVRVKWFTQYVFPTETFTGDFDVFINVVNVVKGGGAMDKAGHIAVMFSPTEKYVYMGIPADPIAINVLNLFECQAYFCAGNKLPSPPIMPLPAQFGTPPIDYNAMETGAGLSFGARVSLEGGFKGSASIFGCDVDPYAKLWLAAGFDILITQTAEPVYCQGGKERGINNWYATGQAFITGGMEVGCSYKCGPLSDNITLVSASISAYVFAQLPRPSYVTGTVSAEFKILSFGGSISAKATFGEECVKEEMDKNIVFIEAITPVTGSINVQVTQNIVVDFTKPIEKFTFELADETDKDKKVQYRGMVEQQDIVVHAGATVIPCDLKWNSAKTQLTLVPKISYPENTYVEAIVSVRLQFNKGGGWQNTDKIEKDTTIFKTKMEPVSIPVANVQYAYPMPGMENYYRNESNQGYIRLLTLPVKPMKLQPNFAYHVVFYTGGEEVARVTNVTVNNQSSVDQFTYPIPNASLQNGKGYTLKLMKAELVDQTRDIKDTDDKTISLGTYAKAAEDSVILEYAFTASRFGSFADKMAYYNISEVTVSGNNVVHVLTPNNKDLTANTAEEFSTMETFGVVVGGVKISNKFVRAVGADFSTGFTIPAGVHMPDSVGYSYYNSKMYVQYNVFSELQKQNHSGKVTAISCAVQNDINACNATGSSAATFPKGKYYYKMGYYLPGKEIKTSEVMVGFDLPASVILQ